MGIACSRCGKDNPENRTGCEKCGYPLGKNSNNDGNHNQNGTMMLKKKRDSSSSSLSFPPGEDNLLDNRYRILEKIGQGGMGEVYKAEQIHLKKIFAIKKMSDEKFDNSAIREMAKKKFHEEAQILSRLNHPGLPQVVDFFVQKEIYTVTYPDGVEKKERNLFFLVMSLIQGKTLSAVMEERENTPFSQEEIRDWLFQLLDILEYLHSLNPPIVYRDIKPSNIMLTSEGKIFLIDFGIAKIFQPQLTGTLIGTPGFAAPEQYSGITDPRSDIYSLGATFHYLLTGLNPRQKSGDIFGFTPVSESNWYVSVEMENLIMRMLSPNMEDRPSCIAEIRRELESMKEPSVREREQKKETSKIPGETLVSQKLPVNGKISPAFLPPAVTSVLKSAPETTPMPPSQGTLPLPSHRPLFSGRTIMAAGIIILFLILGMAVIVIKGKFITIQIGTPPNPSPVSVVVTATYVPPSPMVSISPTVSPSPSPSSSPGQGLCVKTLQGHTGSILCVSVSPDGKKIASSGKDDTIKIWDKQTGECIATLEGHRDDVWGCGFSPNGKELVSCSADGTAKIWDLENSRCVLTLTGNSKTLYSACFSPDGQRILSCGSDNTLTLWDSYTGERLKLLTGHNDSVETAIFSPDGSRIASCSADNTVRIWNGETGTFIKSLKGHTDPLESVSFSPDGHLLASGGFDTTVKIWNVLTGECLKTLNGHQGTVYCVDFSPDGNLLASPGRDRAIILWDTGGTGKTLDTNSKSPKTEDKNNTKSPNSDKDKTLPRKDESSDPPPNPMLFLLEGHNGSVNGVSFFPDGKELVSGSEDTTIKLWRLP